MHKCSSVGLTNPLFYLFSSYSYFSIYFQFIDITKIHTHTYELCIIITTHTHLLYDRNTQTVGITSLGLEHTQLLGRTYRDIAWQKSGIIKPGSSVYTTHQNDECLEVLIERAKEKDVCHVSNIVIIYCRQKLIESHQFSSNFRHTFTSYRISRPTNAMIKPF